MRIERLPDGRDFVDANGDVRHMSDWNPEDDPRQSVEPDLLQASVSLKRSVRFRRPSRRGGWSMPEISGREIGQAIADALFEAEDSLGRKLTDVEEEDIARQVEHELREGL